ncbi:MAG: LLM class F420-dependent oxidoreductase [Alphaproteobacteria bacterium]|nr:MAG: LLM class F420-dependent oxidoreductase [Alphaproteobacteria bacterium]
MKIGVMVPSQELGNDPIALRDFVQGAEELGFDYLQITDHVLQVEPSDDPEAFTPYTIKDAFQEPFVTFGYIAGCTKTIEMGTAILILPQRQAVLVAKQAAQADFLSGGRLRLGIGVGWQQIEFDALGMPWKGRGKLCEEQIEVMRGLWNNELFEFDGKYHKVPKSGLNPNSVQKPIPIWFGGMADAVADRTGRIGDGWMPLGPPDMLGPQFDIMYAAAEKAGRKASDIGIEAFFGLTNMMDATRITMDDAIALAKKWQARGATNYTFTPLGLGITDVQEHLKVSNDFKERMQAL